jgi:hypothetical protein
MPGEGKRPAEKGNPKKLALRQETIFGRELALKDHRVKVTKMVGNENVFVVRMNIFHSENLYLDAGGEKQDVRPELADVAPKGPGEVKNPEKSEDDGDGRGEQEEGENEKNISNIFHFLSPWFKIQSS